MTDRSRSPCAEGNGFQLDEQIAHLLRRAHQRASSLFQGQLAQYELTPAQYFALTRLREKQRLSQNQLGRETAMDPATIQGVVQRLAARGFIDRKPDPLDRRRMVLELTGSGRELSESLIEAASRVNHEVLSPLQKEEQDAFIRLLGKLA
ncbi:MarR family winged helix-turn-helix transcriptional regulator [Fodinicurvata sediminis]|uniref:MarR family winged helix-turn-helix transcriptional regulator n=1 Tax=Fodinicurvata sediminis TaxID=1121832 RepID=UPI00047E2B0E|nr:MarR family transcriptional regulator [Fodinicurvata sediminis]